MGRHLAIGDIHGCITALRTLIQFIGLRDDDVLVTLGDYVNRGEDTRAVLQWLLEFDGNGQLVPLRGNHEVMMCRAREGDEQRQRWLQSGGDATLRSYAPEGAESGGLADIPNSHWRFLDDRLLPYYEIDSHFFVHANAYPDMPLDDQPDYMLYWEKFNDPPRHASGKIMICGHTSQKSGRPLRNANAICIDTWACGEVWLTCLDVASGQLWQANKHGETQSLHLDDLDEGSVL